MVSHFYTISQQSHLSAPTDDLVILIMYITFIPLSYGFHKKYVLEEWKKLDYTE